MIQISVSSRRFIGFLLFAGCASAQTVTATLGAGNDPRAVAVNPVTNKVYVVNCGAACAGGSGGGSVTVIDGATNNATTVSDANAGGPFAVAVNPVTNKIYVANFSNNVTVIDGATNNVTTVTDPNASEPYAVAVNPVTNKIYVANGGSHNVTVIDGATNTTTTVTDPNARAPQAVAVNPVTNKIYVANATSNNVTVIDGASNSVSDVGTGSEPLSVAVNPVTNKIYVANNTSNNVTVIDGATNSTTTVTAGEGPYAVAVNPVTNKIYVPNIMSNDVTVIDGARQKSTTVTDPNANGPFAAAVNPVTNQIYVANEYSGVTVIDGATNNTTTVTDPNASDPTAVAVNPVTNKIYVPNYGTNNVTVIDGATNGTATATDPNASSPWAVAVNPVTNKIYVPNYGSNNVTVIDGSTNNVTTVTDPNASAPHSVAVNPVTNKIYVANHFSNNVSVIDGASNNVITVTDPNAYGPETVAVNPVTNKIYVTNCGSACQGGSGSANVTVIDGATNGTATVTAGTEPFGLDVNPVTNKIYVTNVSSNNVTVIDGATNSTTTVSAGTAPVAVAVDRVTNKIYVANYRSSNVTVIDGATNNTITVTDPNANTPQAIAVNPVTNKIYVANCGSACYPGSGSGSVTVIDGATNNITTISDPKASGPFAVAVNPVTNKIYAVNNGSANITVIDGSTNTIKTVTDSNANHPMAVAVNPVTNQAYLVNNGGGNVTVIAESNVQTIPLTASIAAQTNNQVTGASASFSFSASSSFSPTAPPPDGLYYQVDTWQGPWQPAASQGSNNFSGTVSGLAPGVHILYAYSTDGQDATSTNTGFQGSPLISNITAYTFLAVPATGTPSVVSTSPNAASGAAQTFVLTYSDTGGTDALQYVWVDFNASLTLAYGCSVRYAQVPYNQANSALYLYNDAGTAAMGPLTPGSSGTLANSQCTINGTGSSVTTDGDTLTLNLSVTASSSFEGPKNIYMRAADNGAANTGWVNKGTWTPSPSFVPSIVSVSPNPASGASQNFALEYSDTGGYGALTSVAALFNGSLSSKKACYVYYAPRTNLLYLQNDGGVGATSITPGSGTLANSQCTINGSSSSITTSGNNLTLNLAVTASSSFNGAKNIYMYAADDSSANTGWTKEGTWTPSTSFVASVVSVSPNPASGTSQNFALEYSDTGGYAALTSVAVLFNSSLTSKKACYVYYAPRTNLLYLQNDSGQGATSITPGSGTLANSQCTINGSSTSIVTSRNNLTLNLAVTGSSSFTGVQKIYMDAADDSGATSGWVDEGSWTP